MDTTHETSRDSEKALRYKKIVESILQCKRCPLHRTRKNPVPGEGPISADIMFIGEAPGRREDETGRPFVGSAGRILDALLASIGVRREDVYITNVVKCRPPGNRDPTPEEIESCLPYLIEQIRIIEPKLIITLGRHAGKTIYSLLGRRWRGLSAEHGVRVEGVLKGVNMKVVVIPTYHPAAALYNPQIRRVLEEDFRGPIRSEVERIASRDYEGSRRGGRSRSLLDYMK
ncbi:MAG: uracil-DNA glycosylase [Desulfurococcales archaeon]|nr:uracil-DNA glycosylase [Desulfurococcales archaeon]